MKHTNIGYYSVTDQINKKDLAVKWCPMGDMIGNYMTNPNKGALFTKFRDQNMGDCSCKESRPRKAKK